MHCFLKCWQFTEYPVFLFSFSPIQRHYIWRWSIYVEKVTKLCAHQVKFLLFPLSLTYGVIWSKSPTFWTLVLATINGDRSGFPLPSMVSWKILHGKENLRMFFEFLEKNTEHKPFSILQKLKHYIFYRLNENNKILGV